MKVVLFTLFILVFIAYLLYKIKQSFSKKELIYISIAILLIIGFSSYLTHKHQNKLPNSFKEDYLKNKNIKILKLSYNQTNVETLSSNKEIYDFIYIIIKNNQEYVCEAKNVSAQLIEDEYVFKPYEEECRIK
ncbi:MAG: hypothetical protein KGV43_00770 [Arcobacter sp.]|nr:hypothetical protein [Arcobacter sp.]